MQAANFLRTCAVTLGSETGRAAYLTGVKDIVCMTAIPLFVGTSRARRFVPTSLLSLE